MLYEVITAQNRLDAVLCSGLRQRGIEIRQTGCTAASPAAATRQERERARRRKNSCPYSLKHFCSLTYGLTYFCKTIL